jgi:hypothetical protein
MREVNGSRVELILAVPVLAALITLLPWPVRLQGVARVVGACVSGVFAFVASASVGTFFLPSALVLVLAALPIGWASRPTA